VSAPAPSLDALVHRLAECPPELLDEPRRGRRDGIRVDAVAWDVLRELGAEPAPDAVAQLGDDRNHLRLVLVGCWLLLDPALREAPRLPRLALPWLRRDLKPLAGLVAAERFVEDPDRREELVRLLLDALGLRPAGETAAQAADRLKTLSSVERDRVLRATRAQQKRAEELRRRMQEREALEAAARISRE